MKIPPFVALKDKHDIVQLLSAKIIMKLTKLTKLMFLQINVKDVKKRERERDLRNKFLVRYLTAEPWTYFWSPLCYVCK